MLYFSHAFQFFTLMLIFTCTCMCYHQVDDLRNQLRRMDTDRSRMKSHLEEARIEEELRERRRKRSSM